MLQLFTCPIDVATDPHSQIWKLTTVLTHRNDLFGKVLHASQSHTQHTHTHTHTHTCFSFLVDLARDFLWGGGQGGPRKNITKILLFCTATCNLTDH